MLRRLALAIALVFASLVGDASAAFVGTQRSLLSVQTAPQPIIDFNFVESRFTQSPSAPTSTVASVITTTRAGTNATNLLPTSPSGFAYTTFGANVARLTAGSGILVEVSRVNSLLNSAAPVTQTTGSLANGTYTLWVNGTGSAQMSAGTATGCGTDTASQGVPVNFTLTGAAGTCTVTVAGSLNAFQLELGAFGTSLIVTAGAVGTRATDVVTVTSVPTFTSVGSVFVSENRPVFTGIFDRLVAVSTGGITNAIEVEHSTSVDDGILTIISSTVVAPIADRAILGPNLFVGTWSGNRLVGKGRTSRFTSAASGTPTGLNKINVGSRGNGGSQLNGYLTSLRIWPNFTLTSSMMMGLLR